MTAERVDSNTDSASLLNGGYEDQGYRASQYYLARQTFLRSYHFSVEETFKDKLRKSIRRLKEESLEEIVKESLQNLMKALKGFMSRRYENLVEGHLKKKRNLSVGACFPSLHNPAATRKVLSYCS
ncbi:hypothetical protein SUGI_0877710 [Cryptomeria japonica]|nr:hypothetical protein SUGI_0877710 [Cryptomeria japonica]